MDIWQKVREKLAYNRHNSVEMYEQTHNPISIQQHKEQYKPTGLKNEDAIQEMYRLMYQKKRTRKNLV